jgi:hypothetical protein
MTLEPTAVHEAEFGEYELDVRVAQAPQAGRHEGRVALAVLEIGMPAPKYVTPRYRSQALLAELIQLLEEGLRSRISQPSSAILPPTKEAHRRRYAHTPLESWGATSDRSHRKMVFPPARGQWPVQLPDELFMSQHFRRLT